MLEMFINLVIIIFILGAAMAVAYFIFGLLMIILGMVLAMITCTFDSIKQKFTRH